MPGKYDVSGLWPGLWLLGNLVRATYINSSENIWPWSYDKCNKEDDKNNQLISACHVYDKSLGLNPYQGRGAPEIGKIHVYIEICVLLITYL